MTEYKNYDGYYKYDRQVADSYDETRRDEKHWQMEDKFVKNYFKKNKVNKLLDIPIGTGRFLKYYDCADYVVGVDISQSMIEKCKEKLLINTFSGFVHLEIGDIFDLKFNDLEFDCVIVFRLFHLMPEESVKAAIKELCRVSSKDIIVQSYVQPNKFISIIRKITAKLSSRYKSNDVLPIQKSTPWSHIQAYYHDSKLLDSEFQKYNFLPTCIHSIDNYGNYDVKAAIYSRQN
jgi:ubiquinone/menaquinone biosynthesis C-methylase UbiE